MSFFPCQVSLCIPQRELERSGIERGESRALLHSITDTYVASDHPTEHLKTQGGFVTSLNGTGECSSFSRCRRDNDAEHRPNGRWGCGGALVTCRQSGDRA
jgi:hypothetical protein